jgi:hypothetical protein
MGLPRTTFFVIAGVGAAGIVIFVIWRRRQSAAASSGTAAAGTSSGSCPDGSTPDANGNCPDSSDVAGELATLQTEIGDLEANQGSAGSSGGTAGTSGGPTGTPAPPVTTGTPGGTSTSAPSTPGTSAASWAFPAPSGVQAYDVAKNGYRIRWSPVTGPAGQKPASYTVQTWKTGAAGAVNEHISTSTSTAEYGPGGVGLAKGTYHTLVWANGGPKAPQHGDTGNVTLTS